MTTHVSPQVKDWSPVRESDVIYHKVIGYLPAAHGLTLGASDTIQMVKVPLGAIVTDVVLLTGILTGTVTIDVGDGGVPTRYINAANVAAASITRMNRSQSGVPYTYTAEDTIDITFNAQNPADNVAIALIVGYVTGVDITP